MQLTSGVAQPVPYPCVKLPYNNCDTEKLQCVFYGR
jgi:hypothetical protein